MEKPLKKYTVVFAAYTHRGFTPGVGFIETNDLQNYLDTVYGASVWYVFDGHIEVSDDWGRR